MSAYAVDLKQVVLVLLAALDLHLEDFDVLVHLLLASLELDGLLGGVVDLSILLHEASEGVVGLLAALQHHHLPLKVLDDLLQFLHPVLVELLLGLQLVLR